MHKNCIIDYGNPRDILYVVSCLSHTPPIPPHPQIAPDISTSVFTIFIYTQVTQNIGLIVFSNCIIMLTVIVTTNGYTQTTPTRIADKYERLYPLHCTGYIFPETWFETPLGFPYFIPCYHIIQI